VLATEMQAFGVKSIRDRLFLGGLPPILLEGEADESFFAEWIDSYYARDVQELFRVEKRSGFLRLLEILLRQSGGQAETASLARMSGLSRPTVMNYLEVFELTHVVRLLRPYHDGSKQELLKQPKVYGFDTGFVRYARGWSELREEDCGLLWEHLVLDILQAHVQKDIHYWRNKQHQEIDFIIPKGRGEADAIECKWKSTGAEWKNFQPFRSIHPKGRNILVTSNQPETVVHMKDGLEFILTNAAELPTLL
jgi:predicted AAA+ superfamily ATPase